MTLVSNFIIKLPLVLLVFFLPAIYMMNIRRFHVFCTNNMNTTLANIIKFITPIPNEYFVRLMYTFVLTNLFFNWVFIFVKVLIRFLFE